MIVALGITAVLAMNDYDLSAGGLVSLCATTVIVLMSSEHVGLNWVVAIVLTIGIGGLLGLTNGVLIAYVRLPSFILTIATGTVFAGLALQITDSQSVYEGIPQAFHGAGQRHGPRVLATRCTSDLPCSSSPMLFLRHTEPGRYMYAIGGNPEAGKARRRPRTTTSRNRVRARRSRRGDRRAS